MTYTAENGERLVAQASPRLKDFRVEFEKISIAASRAAREGREGLDSESAIRWFADEEWHLRLPLQRRFIAGDAADAVAHYHAKRFKTLLGRNEPWPDMPAQAALDLFASHGLGTTGIELIRSYFEMQEKRLRSDYSLRNPRRPRIARPEGTVRAISAISAAIVGAIPARKAELLRNLESVGPYVGRWGNDEDCQWLDEMKREIWREKRA